MSSVQEKIIALRNMRAEKRDLEDRIRLVENELKKDLISDGEYDLLSINMARVMAAYHR